MGATQLRYAIRLDSYNHNSKWLQYHPQWLFVIDRSGAIYLNERVSGIGR